MYRFLRLSVLLVGVIAMAGNSYAADTAPKPTPSFYCCGLNQSPDKSGFHTPAVTPPPLVTEDALGPEVEQPIEFPHNRHAGNRDQGGMEINCMYCHTYARRSMVAGIPPLRKCIGCHQSIESVRDKPRIKKLFEYWETKKPIPWKKVHDLPDFVRFNHERHIQRFYFQQGKPVQVVCGYCHGDIKTMTVARKQKPITMGWCRACHMKDHPVDAVSNKTSQGPNDCFTCHK